MRQINNCLVERCYCHGGCDSDKISEVEEKWRVFWLASNFLWVRVGWFVVF